MTDPTSEPTRMDAQTGLPSEALKTKPSANLGIAPLRVEPNLVRTLYDVTRDLGAVLDSKEVLNRAARSVVETLNVGHATISIFDVKRGSAKVSAEYPDKGGLGTPVPREGNLGTTRLQTELAVIVQADRLDEESAELKAALQKQDIKTVLLVAMVFQGSFIGAIQLDVYKEARKFTTSEVEGVQAIAGQLAVSIRNAQLYEETERRAQQLERIAGLSRRIMATLDRNTIFNIVAEEARQLLKVDGVSISLHQPGDSALFLYLLKSDETEKNPPPQVVEFPFNLAALRFVCNNGESLLLDDISGSAYPDYTVLARHVPPDHWDNGVLLRSAIVVPLRTTAHVFGTLNLTYHEAAAYTGADLRIVEQIATQVAIAIENAQQFAQTSSRVETERLMNRMVNSLQQSDLQSILLSTTREIAETLGAKRARVRLKTPETAAPDVARLRKLLETKLSGSGDDTAKREDRT